MKRMTFAGGSIITGGAVADSLLDYATKLSGSDASVSVDVPVLATDGSTSIHTLLIGPASQFDVEDVVPSVEMASLSAEEELVLFPVPALPSVGDVATTEVSPAEESDTAQFNQAVADIDNSLY